MTHLSTHRLAVRFRDCDPLGHVNNAVYLTYLEQARFQLWLAQFGQHPAHSHRPGLIMARAEIDFRAQVRYGDVLDVRVNLDAIGRSSFTYSYEIADAASGRLVAAAKTVLVHFDYEKNVSVPIDEELRVKLATPVLGAPVLGGPQSPGAPDL
jgi:acyl-CoA thioester hydrolase